MDKSQRSIDLGLLGALIRHARSEAGFKTAEVFADAITAVVGYPVSKETIYKIESGKQEPKLSLYLAIKRALYPYTNPKFDKILEVSVCDDWRYPLSEVASNDLFTLYFSNYRYDELRL